MKHLFTAKKTTPAKPALVAGDYIPNDVIKQAKEFNHPDAAISMYLQRNGYQVTARHYLPTGAVECVTACGLHVSTSGFISRPTANYS